MLAWFITNDFVIINSTLKQAWIYRQLLTLSEPLHPTLPPLLLEFVNSILLSAITPGPRGSSSYGSNTTSNKSHSPFTDEEVSLVDYSIY